MKKSVVIGIGVLLILCVASCSDEPDLRTHPETEVVSLERTIADHSRVTSPNGSFPGSNSRELRTRIWMSTDDADPSSRPLLVMAHGFGGLPEKFNAFAHEVARQGFVVAAPAFPLTNENAPGGHETALNDFANQPADLSFVISSLTEAVTDPSGELADRFDPDRIAVLGHSLGGVTLLGLTRKDCCLDDRVKATIFVAAPTFLASAFGPAPLHREGPPTIILHGTNDASVGINFGHDLFAAIAPPRTFVGLLAGEHSDALESQVEPPIAVRDAAQRATVAFLRSVFFGDTDGFEAVLDELTLGGNEVRYEAASI